MSREIELLNMHEDMFGTVLSVLVNDDPHSYHEWLDSVGFTGERLNPEEKKAIYEWLRPDTMKDGSSSEFIWLREANPAHLAHELIHLATKTLSEKQIPISHENDEVMCYFVEYWMNRIMQGWKDAPTQQERK